VFKKPLSLFIGVVTAVGMELTEPRVRTGVWERTTRRTAVAGPLGAGRSRRAAHARPCPDLHSTRQPCAASRRGRAHKLAHAREKRAAPETKEALEQASLLIE
jgi:hypothetical protein